MTAHTISSQEKAENHPPKIVNSLIIVSLLGFSCFVLFVFILHWLQPGLDPLNKAVSFYVHGPGHWLLTAGLFGLGLGSFALTGCLGFILDNAAKEAGWWLLGIWSVSIIFCGIFPADPPGNWGSPPSTAGMLHNSFALIAFLSLPIAGLRLTRASRLNAEWISNAPGLQTIAIAALVSFGIFIVSLLPVIISPGPPLLLGLTERILLAVYVTWLGATALVLRKEMSKLSTTAT